MKLIVDRITATPTEERFDASAEWWQRHAGAAGRDEDLEVLEPFAFALRVSRMGEDLLIEGTMSGAIRPACSRCAERYRHALREELRLVLEPAGTRLPADPEAAAALARDGLCLGDELDVGWYRGPEIRLDAFFTEVIALALPMQPLPEVDDQGRCSVCGIDRSKPVESIETSRSDSPFAVLATLRGAGHEGGS